MKLAFKITYRIARFYTSHACTNLKHSYAWCFINMARYSPRDFFSTYQAHHNCQQLSTQNSKQSTGWLARAKGGLGLSYMLYRDMVQLKSLALVQKWIIREKGIKSCRVSFQYALCEKTCKSVTQRVSDSGFFCTIMWVQEALIMMSFSPWHGVSAVSIATDTGIGGRSWKHSGSPWTLLWRSPVGCYIYSGSASSQENCVLFFLPHSRGCYSPGSNGTVQWVKLTGHSKSPCLSLSPSKVIITLILSILQHVWLE